jgi:hypothetical protein
VAGCYERGSEPSGSIQGTNSVTISFSKRPLVNGVSSWEHLAGDESQQSSVSFFFLLLLIRLHKYLLFLLCLEF